MVSTEVPHALLTATQYEPAAFTEMDGDVAPVLHKYDVPVPAALKLSDEPAQMRVSLPSRTLGSGFMVKFVPLSVPMVGGLVDITRKR